MVLRPGARGTASHMFNVNIFIENVQAKRGRGREGEGEKGREGERERGGEREREGETKLLQALIVKILR